MLRFGSSLMQITGYHNMPPAEWSRVKPKVTTRAISGPQLAWEHNLGVHSVNMFTQALQAEAAAAHDKHPAVGGAVCGRPCYTLLSTCAHSARFGACKARRLRRPAACGRR